MGILQMSKGLPAHGSWVKGIAGSSQRCHLGVPKRCLSLLAFPSPSWVKDALPSVSVQNCPPHHWHECFGGNIVKLAPPL